MSEEELKESIESMFEEHNTEMLEVIQDHHNNSIKAFKFGLIGFCISLVIILSLVIYKILLK